MRTVLQPRHSGTRGSFSLRRRPDLRESVATCLTFYWREDWEGELVGTVHKPESIAPSCLWSGASLEGRGCSYGQSCWEMPGVGHGGGLGH